ncbi:hypothetical protein [Litorisediminicola beolgyonensis]|uniref:Uncharacterized protein n=1 Tax=Litorisediminicola beolgyonensis TaxID=1173614 RepID=A0ABW3ZL48_9RHOB
MRWLAALAMLAEPAVAQGSGAYGTPEGCARLAGDESAVERQVAILPGHLSLRGETCMITAVQTGTLMATCPGPAETRKRVFGIGPSADGLGIVLTAEDGAQEILDPCG